MFGNGLASHTGASVDAEGFRSALNQRAHRIGRLRPSAAEHRIIKIAEVVDEHRLRRRIDACRLHARDVIVGEEAAVLDAVASVRVGHGGERLLVGAQHLLDRRIANGVERHLVALAVIVQHVFVEHRVGLAGHADRLVVAPIGLRHPGGAPARAAVGEDLHRPDAQHVVPGAGHQPGAMAVRTMLFGPGSPSKHMEVRTGSRPLRSAEK